MTKIKEVYSTKPWFISIPRSGANWILGMLELYFDKPRGPIIKPNQSKTKDFRWVYPFNTSEKDLLLVAHHDQQGLNVNPSNSKEGDVFLYRNPMDVIYSNIKRDGDRSRLLWFLYQYETTFNKWAVDGLAKLVICYEDMTVSPKIEFKKLVKHFKGEWDEAKFENVFNTVTKQALVDKNPEPGEKTIAYSEMLTHEYALGRESFRKEYSNRCKVRLLNKQTKPWLERYFQEE